MESRSLFLSNNLKGFILYIANSKILILKTLTNTKYIFIPTSVRCSMDNKKLIIFNQNSNSVTEFELFMIKLDKLIKNLKKIFKKKLILKGLGYRITLLKTNKIEFKLGFSHLIYLNIPKNIKVRTKKTFLFLESSDSILLGNFVHKVISLKYPDSYKGKGFWSKYQKMVFKPVKKK